MIKEENRKLLKQAARLATLGVSVERARKRLKTLVDRGVDYTAPEMRKALEQFQKLDKEWKRLETEHLVLVKKVDGRKNNTLN